MPKILIKDIFVEIRHSMGRFLSILLIVALGVAFYAGIKASAPDMKNTADAHFDNWNVQDIQVYSTLGIDQSDLDALKKVQGVSDVQGQFSMDFLARKGSMEQVVKVISWNREQTINLPRLMEGRMPEKDDECVIEADSVNNELFGSYEIGDRITLLSGTKDPVSDTLKTDTFTITGKAYNPNYLSYEKGTSSIGSGSVDTFIYVPQSAIKSDYYTEADILVEGAREADTYSDAYFDLTDPVVTRIEDLADTQIAARKAELQKEVDKARKEADEKLADAKQQLDDGQKELEDGKAKLDEAQKDIQNGLSEIAANEDKLASSRTELQNGWASYNQNKAMIESGLSQVNDGIAQIQAAQAQLPDLQSKKAQLLQAKDGLAKIDQGIAGISQLAAGLDALNQQIAGMEAMDPENENLPALKEQQAALQAQLSAAIGAATGNPALSAADAIAALQAQKQQIISAAGDSAAIDASISQIDQGIAQIQSLSGQLADLQNKKNQLLAGQAQLPAALAALQNAQTQIDDGQAQLDSAKNQVAEGQSEYDSGLSDYEKGLDELKTNREKYEKEKKKAEDQIADAQKQVDDLDGKWIVLGRNSHYSYRDYQSCADRMDGIASVFPVFFYLVAALVCMTTMTRMVDEQRSEIGTLKALGYNKAQIAFKYLAYAGLASIIGCILGCCIGMFLFPYVIFTAWNTMYNLETIQFVSQLPLMLESSAVVTLIVLAATIFSIYRELLDVPSQLMRPKAGIAGKKILLEKIHWIWNRTSFMQKVTLRNLFRYKKRFFMTVIGIAGCSALLVAGFGLNDSIGSIVTGQFNDIYHYDASVTADADSEQDLEAEISKLKDVSQVYRAETMPVVIHIKNKDQTGNLNIIDDPEGFDVFMTFHPMNDSPQEMRLDDSGVFISVKMADDLGLHIGDDIAFKTTDDQEIKAPVAGIFEQYVNHQIYVTNSLFESWKVKEKPNVNFLLINETTESDAENELGAALMNLDGVKSVQFYSALITNFNNMISAIKLVVIVLVLSAALLAFVVLYNLSNVNISERMREIATIKVLGFTEKEVNQYVNRESLILALIGSLLGLGLGIILHHLIMNLAELDDVRFGRNIYWYSFLLSAILTMVFAAAVNWIMKFKLRKIEMVESLKAVE